MTTVDILFRYAVEPGDAAAFALGNLREVYGIRSLLVDRSARTVRVEFDATRLNGATVASLLRRAGLQLSEEIALVPPQPAPEAAATA